MPPLSLPWFFMVVSFSWGMKSCCGRHARGSVTAAAAVLDLMALLDQLAFALAALVAAHLTGLADGHVALAAALGLLRVLLAAIVLLLLAHLSAPVVDRGDRCPSSVPSALLGLAACVDQFPHALAALLAGFAHGGAATDACTRGGSAGGFLVALVMGGGLLPSHGHLRG